MPDIWNAKTYGQFLDLRTRPARDLLFAIPNSFAPKTVYDLGCGPGNSTILLKDRWPHAEVIGIDSSIDMLKEAKADYPHIHFIEGNIADFAPKQKVDCIFANASLQWLSHHDTLIPKLFGFLNPGGVLAIQMPNNFHSPSHQTTIHLLKNNHAWQHFLKALRYGALTKPFYHLPSYYDLFTKVDAKQTSFWETEYFQELENHQAIFDWVKGTGLRPVLSKMSDQEQADFAKAYVKAITDSYPLQANGKILLPFKRLFMIGFK